MEGTCIFFHDHLTGGSRAWEVRRRWRESASIPGDKPSPGSTVATAWCNFRNAQLSFACPSVGIDAMQIPEAIAPALRAFATAAARQQRGHLRHLYLFGSQARGEGTPDSDVDVAVILDDGADTRIWDAVIELGELAYSILLETGVDIQPVPIRQEYWEHPEAHNNPGFVTNVTRDAIEVPLS